MRRPIQQHIPGVGIVTLRAASIGNVADADGFAAEAAEEDRPLVFVNHLLSTMLVDPSLTPEEIANLPDDAATALVGIAADVLGIREEFDAISTDLPPRERLYQAYQEYQRALFAELSDTLAKAMAPIREQMSEVLGRLTIPNNVLEGINESFRQMAAVNLRLVIPDYRWTEPFLADMAGFAEMLKSIQESWEASIGQSIQSLVAKLDLIKPPEPFLSQGLLVSGLNSSLIHSPTYILPTMQVPSTEDEIEKYAEDALHRRLVDAYDILSHLEQSLRALIETRLREIHGIQWWKRGVPEAVRTACEERKLAKEKPLEASHHPIFYAYVDDYKTIIVKRDNWNVTFADLFRNKTELEASFAWVGKVRDAVAHVRPVSDDDYLWFVAGARWLQVAISRVQSAD